MTEDRPDDDTAEQQILRFDDLLPGSVLPDGFEAPRPPRRRRHVWIVAAVALVLVAGGVAGFGISRQGTAAAQSALPRSSESAAPSTAAPGPVIGAASTLPSGEDTLVLGDSLALIMYPWLADLLPDRYVSYGAEVGSSADWARAHLDQMKQAGERIPKVVLVSAGTNDFYAADFQTEVAAVLGLLGPKRCVVWADIARPDTVNGASVDPASRLNEVLAAAALTHPNLHVLDWAELTARHPTWLAGDGVHPIDEGAQARAEQYATAAAACSPIDPDAPTAAKQVLPTSAFYVPGGSSTGTTGTSGAYTPPPIRSTPSPTMSRTAKPTSKPTRTHAPTPSAEPTPEATPTSTADPPPSGPPATPAAPEPTGG